MHTTEANDLPLTPVSREAVIAEARAAGRAHGLKEAAQVCWGMRCGPDHEEEIQDRLLRQAEERIRDLAQSQPAENTLDVDALAQEIRRVDGNHTLGAGALAEALMPFLAGAPAAEPKRDDAVHAEESSVREQLAQRIMEWLAKYGKENTATLLLYEAMKTLKPKVAAQSPDAVREAGS